MKLILLTGAVLLLLVMALTLYDAGRWSAADNLAECAYEAEKLLVHMRSENTKEKLEKRSNLDF